jgi:hypothetical protein
MSDVLDLAPVKTDDFYNRVRVRLRLDPPALRELDTNSALGSLALEPD